MMESVDYHAGTPGLNNTGSFVAPNGYKYRTLGSSNQVSSNFVPPHRVRLTLAGPHQLSLAAMQRLQR